MLRATLIRPDLADPTLASRWHALATACAASAFLSWAWVGCLAAQRYTDPLLAEVHDGPDLIGLALFNRARTPLGPALFLHETGDPAWDSVYIEHNGVLATPGREEQVLAAILRAARTAAPRIVLSGVGQSVLANIPRSDGILGPLKTTLAPFVRLDPTANYLDGLSRNARAQLRRSDRSYQAAGPIKVDRAASPEQALDWLARLLPLHVATWSGRGIASGFATPQVQRFHHELIRRGVGPNGDSPGIVDLLHISAGPRTIGYLYNLIAPGRVATYQSGFDYAAAAPHEKPGLTSHAAAIARATALGFTEYDFLAGDTRYKRSLANDVRPLHWLSWQRRLSRAGVAALARKALRR